jgi:hypothetical protein
VEGFRELGDLVGHAFLFLERDEPVVIEELHKVTAQTVLFVGAAPEVHGAGVALDRLDHLDREPGKAFEVTPSVPLVGEYPEERRLGPGVEARVIRRLSGADFLGKEPQGLDELFPSAFQGPEDRLKALAELPVVGPGPPRGSGR